MRERTHAPGRLLVVDDNKVNRLLLTRTLQVLGHAVVARTTGARPAIALAGFGGLTTFEPPRPLSRGRCET